MSHSGRAAQRLRPRLRFLQKFFRNLGPLLTSAIEQRLFVVLRPVRSIVCAIPTNALAPSLKRFVPEAQEGSLHRPHIFSGKPPIISSQSAQIEKSISSDASGKVDVRIEIDHGERTHRTKYRR